MLRGARKTELTSYHKPLWEVSTHDSKNMVYNPNFETVHQNAIEVFAVPFKFEAEIKVFNICSECLSSPGILIFLLSLYRFQRVPYLPIVTLIIVFSLSLMLVLTTLKTRDSYIPYCLIQTVIHDLFYDFYYNCRHWHFFQISWYIVIHRGRAQFKSKGRKKIILRFNIIYSTSFQNRWRV